MFVTCDWVMAHMNEWAPENSAMPWDNAGLQIGEPSQKIETILVALDCTEAVVEEAISVKADMVITHHPMIFKPIKRILSDTSLGRRIFALIKNQIGLFSAHTNLDIADGGVNDVLFEALDLKEKESLMPPCEEESGLGRVGRLENPIPLEEFVQYIGKRLELTDVRFTMCLTHGKNGLIKKAGICSGSGSSEKYFRAALQKGCDVFITGDVKYHEAQTAMELGIALVDITHYAGEIIVVEKICRYLREKVLSDGVSLKIIPSKINGQPFQNARVKGSEI
jgi:dinuclear metal center YbgI/SA1388 family protein